MLRLVSYVGRTLVETAYYQPLIQNRNYVAKRKLVRKEWFVYTPRMKPRYKGNPNPRLKMILLEDVENIGIKGSIVEVKRGTGRNYLIPEKRAVYATEENMEKYGISKDNKDTTRNLPMNVVKYLKKCHVDLITPYLLDIHEMTRENWVITRHDIREYFHRDSGLQVPIHCMEIKNCENKIPDDHVIRQYGNYTVKVTIDKIMTIPVPLTVSERPENEEGS